MGVCCYSIVLGLPTLCNSLPFHLPPALQVTDLANIDPMYQYSLRWFVDLFMRAIRDSAPSDDLDVRLQSLNQYFTIFLYTNVCRCDARELRVEQCLFLDVVLGLCCLGHVWTVFWHLPWQLVTDVEALQASGLACASLSFQRRLCCVHVQILV